MTKGLPTGMTHFELNSNHYKIVAVDGTTNPCTDTIKDLQTGKLHTYGRDELYEKTKNARFYNMRDKELSKKSAIRKTRR